jgi:hypothetical protein
MLRKVCVRVRVRVRSVESLAWSMGRETSWYCVKIGEREG